MSRLKEQTNAALSVINTSFKESGLKLATHKTEAVLLIGGRRATTQVAFQLGTDRVVPKDSLRYLGVRLDSRMSFKAHIIKMVNKGDIAATTVSRLMPNLGGPRSGNDALYPVSLHLKFYMERQFGRTRFRSSHILAQFFFFFFIRGNLL